MISRFKNFVNSYLFFSDKQNKKPKSHTNLKYWLLLANVILVTVLIILSNLQILPLGKGDFIFVTILFFLLSLYRPGWMFLFLIGTLALENIYLTPEEWGISLRPYQILAVLIAMSLFIRKISKRGNFTWFKLRWYDGALIVLVIFAFVSSYLNINFEPVLEEMRRSDIRAPLNDPIKQSAVLLSFVFLYFLIRQYIQNLKDLAKIIPFFLSSSLVILLYGLWQNWRFTHGLDSFSTMPGRPNSTFFEPDWFGIYLGFLISLLYSLFYYFNNVETRQCLVSTKKKGFEFLISNFQRKVALQPPKRSVAPSELYARCFTQFLFTKDGFNKLMVYVLLIFSFSNLILTVSRAAWIGVGVGIVFLLVLNLLGKNIQSEKVRNWFKYSKWSWRKMFFFLGQFILVILFSLALIKFFGLTNFQLADRLTSTASGDQKITVACNPKHKEYKELPKKIDKSPDLVNYGCWHINLEAIGIEKARGYEIKEVYRRDPNIHIRSEIYKTLFKQIQKRPLQGIGWGNASQLLGPDANGSGLNSSNIFLEVWLGAGIGGLVAFLAVLVYIVKKAFSRLRKNQDTKERIWGVFVFLGFLVVMIPNLFNAGMLLGFFWLYLAIALMSCNIEHRA